MTDLPPVMPDSSSGFWNAITGVVTAEVQHHAPCVPECRVCYPEGGK